jgi:hypothetical protein
LKCGLKESDARDDRNKVSGEAGEKETEGKRGGNE